MQYLHTIDWGFVGGVALSVALLLTMWRMMGWDFENDPDIQRAHRASSTESAGGNDAAASPVRLYEEWRRDCLATVFGGKDLDWLANKWRGRVPQRPRRDTRYACRLVNIDVEKVLAEQAMIEDPNWTVSLHGDLMYLANPSYPARVVSTSVAISMSLKEALKHSRQLNCGVPVAATWRLDPELPIAEVKIESFREALKESPHMKVTFRGIDITDLVGSSVPPSIVAFQIVDRARHRGVA